MTVLVALKDPAKGGWWLGSDNQINMDHRRVASGQKWVVRSSIAVGLTGHLIWAQALRNVDDWDDVDGQDPWSITRRIRDILREIGEPQIQDGEPGFFDLEGLMVTRRGGLFVLANSLAPIPVIDDDYAAVGGGREFAYGHLDASVHRGEERGAVCHDAIATACRRSTLCGGPPQIAWLETGRDDQSS